LPASLTRLAAAGPGPRHVNKHHRTLWFPAADRPAAYWDGRRARYYQDTLPGVPRHDLRCLNRGGSAPKPCNIFSCSQASPDNREHWLYIWKSGRTNSRLRSTRAAHDYPARAGAARTKGPFELLLRVPDHQRDGKPYPRKQRVVPREGCASTERRGQGAPKNAPRPWMTVARSGACCTRRHGLRGVEWPRAQSVAVIDGAFSAPVRCYSCYLRGGARRPPRCPDARPYTKLCVANVLAPQIGGFLQLRPAPRTCSSTGHRVPQLGMDRLNAMRC
jgi:hypothetical protein